MKTLQHRRTSRRTARRGATLILICLLMILLVAMVAFAVDVGRMYLVRSQLQTAVDAGALAATLQLKEDDTNIDAAVEAANSFVQANRVGWLTTVPEDAIQIETGTWDAETHSFQLEAYPPSAVRVSASMENEPLFFSNLLGHSSFSVPRSAIASAGGKPMDIILTLDLSGSMQDEGRIQALQEAAPIFIDVLEKVGDDDRIGVMGYGAIIGEYDPLKLGHTGTPYLATPQRLFPDNDNWIAVLEAPITSDFNVVRSALTAKVLQADKYNGWTPIGAALRDSAHYLDDVARDDVEKIIVLMSDGHANRPVGDANGYALQMANYAKRKDIKVYTISLGSAADDKLMQQIANRTDGEFFKATKKGKTSLAESLEEAFRHIADSLKRTQLVQ